MASRILQVALSVAGTGEYSPWVKHDTDQSPFDVSLSVFFGTGLSATLAVQYVADDQSNTAVRPVSVSQSTTTITVTDYGPQNINGAPANAAWGGPFGHGLLVGDYVQLMGTPSGTVDGGYNVTSVTSSTVYTLTSAVSQTLTNAQCQVTSGRVITHPSLTGLTARASGNYQYPVWMSRLTCTAFTSPGVGFLVAIQGK